MCPVQHFFLGTMTGQDNPLRQIPIISFIFYSIPYLLNKFISVYTPVNEIINVATLVSIGEKIVEPPQVYISFIISAEVMIPCNSPLQLLPFDYHPTAGKEFALAFF